MENQMNDWDFYKADDLMDRLKKFSEKQKLDQELEDSIFKFRVDWMFLERKIKTLKRSMPDTIDDLVTRKTNESKEKFEIRRAAAKEALK
jgi:uncharacterized protein YeeX (DUF496 family)